MTGNTFPIRKTGMNIFQGMSSGKTNRSFIKSTKQKITEKGAVNSSTKMAYKGSCVVASAGQGRNRGQVSYLLIGTFVNQSIVVIEGDKSYVDQLFLFYTLKTKYQRFRQISDSYSIRGNLTTKLLAEEESLD